MTESLAKIHPVPTKNYVRIDSIGISTRRRFLSWHISLLFPVKLSPSVDEAKLCEGLPGG